MGVSLASQSSTPKMASLVQQAWMAKRSKGQQGAARGSKGNKGLQAISPEKKLQTVPKAKENATYSPLLSRRLHKIVSMTVEIPPRKPFPPPLVWNSRPRPPPRLASRHYARRPFARPPARPHPYKFPQSQQCPCAGH